MSEDKVKEASFKALSRFIFGEETGYFSPFDKLDLSSENPFSEPISAFRSNLQSAIAVGSIPHLLANSGVLDQRYGAIVSAARIRLLDDEGTDEEKEVRAREIASARMDEDLSKKQTIDLIARTTLSVLDRHLERKEFDVAATELLTQLIVLAWSAFEILVNDTIRVLLNRQPHAIALVARDPQFRNAILGRDELLEHLVSFDFDLSSSMGEIFCESVRMDSYGNIANTVKLLLQEPKLDEELKSSSLWRISQDRNLIAHRRGIVDRRYLKLVPHLKVGERFAPDAKYVDDVFRIIRDSGLSICQSAISRLASTRRDAEQYSKGDS